jgi:PHP family Zn ribbon phosphoesterase
MSYIDYRWASAQIGGWRSDELDQSIRRTTKGDPPFYGVVMLAMLRADTFNVAHLRRAWPSVWDELQARYNAPAALLDTDPAPLRERVMSA